MPSHSPHFVTYTSYETNVEIETKQIQAGTKGVLKKTECVGSNARRKFTPQKCNDPEFILLNDKFCLHRAEEATEFKESEDIWRIYWPLRSSDSNPTESIQDALGRTITT
ncbi:hypothetical protein TNCV_29851 [Trichonephila clavipes]|nr:hypothetical protein TNCV_29851 [Trichonephila clavipes]